MHDYLAQGWKRGLERVPDPYRQALAGRVFQTRNFVEIAMIQAFEHRPKRRLHIGEIHHPSGFRPRISAHMHFDPKGMAVQTRAFVASRYVRQAMRGFDVEDLEDIHAAVCTSGRTAHCIAADLREIRPARAQ